MDLPRALHGREPAADAAGRESAAELQGAAPRSSCYGQRCSIHQPAPGALHLSIRRQGAPALPSRSRGVPNNPTHARSEVGGGVHRFKKKYSIMAIM